MTRLKPYTLDRVCRYDKGHACVIEYLDCRSAMTVIRSATLLENVGDCIWMTVDGFFGPGLDNHYFQKDAYGVTWRLWPSYPTPTERDAALWKK